MSYELMRLSEEGKKIIESALASNPRHRRLYNLRGALLDEGDVDTFSFDKGSGSFLVSARFAKDAGDDAYYFFLRGQGYFVIRDRLSFKVRFPAGTDAAPRPIPANVFAEFSHAFEAYGAVGDGWGNKTCLLASRGGEY